MIELYNKNMSFNPDRPDRFESLLSGSIVRFRERSHLPLTEEEREFKLKNEGKLKEGITILRKLRTKALSEKDPGGRQDSLKEAHHFSEQMAEVIINQAIGEKPSPIDPSYLEALQEARSEYAEQEAESGHALPPQFAIGNLLKAIDDIFFRIEEKAKSVEAPDHKLTKEELKYVFG